MKQTLLTILAVLLSVSFGSGEKVEPIYKSNYLIIRSEIQKQLSVMPLDEEVLDIVKKACISHYVTFEAFNETHQLYSKKHMTYSDELEAYLELKAMIDESDSINPLLDALLSETAHDLCLDGPYFLIEISEDGSFTTEGIVYPVEYWEIRIKDLILKNSELYNEFVIKAAPLTPSQRVLNILNGLKESGAWSLYVSENYKDRLMVKMLGVGGISDCIFEIDSIEKHVQGGIYLKESGEIEFNKEVVEETELPDLVAKGLKEENAPCLVRADGAIPWFRLMEIARMCKNAGCKYIVPLPGRPMETE
ncbi:hypothetical protein JXM67_01950 [candidate division WOR-3 bacterium]|nr:hypothetical protein [candidate division WOR-3 bacterium]